jgi:hypothetical protein
LFLCLFGGFFVVIFVQEFDAGTLPLEPSPYPFFALVIFQIELSTFCPGSLYQILLITPSKVAGL